LPSDLALLSAMAVYVASAVVLGVLSNRLRAVWILLLSIGVATFCMFLLCWNCDGLSRASVGETVVLTLLYFGVALVAGFAVPFLASKYAARLIMRRFNRRAR
jgi:hypothetical protein